MPDFEPILAVPPRRAVRIERPQEEAKVVGFAPLAFLQGPIFTRTRDIIAANVNDLVERSEDPAKMIRMIIVEMEDTLAEVRATAARSIADIKEMRRACDQLAAVRDGWTEKAQLALSKDREDLARAALTERGKVEEMVAGIEAEIAQIDEVLRGYEEDIQRLQAKLAEARGRQASIANRIEGAMTRARASELVHGSRTMEAFAKFETLEREVDFAEARADAIRMGNASLEDQFAELRAAEKVDAELDELKAALARANKGE